MIRRKCGDIEWLEFELLAAFPEVVHGVFLRHGGISEGAYGSLNVIQRVGDIPEAVQVNRQRIQSILQVDKLLTGCQVHGSEVKEAEKDWDEEPICDGLFTNRTGLGLMAKHADCQATLFYDPVNQAIAAVHAGWRGQVQNIYKNTINKMAGAFGSKPSDLLVCISPSLGPENSEFIHYKHELPEEFWQFQIKPSYFDLWAISRHQLERCGIRGDNIEIASIDTFSNPDDFFSYRREKKRGRVDQITGAHGTVIALRTGLKG